MQRILLTVILSVSLSILQAQEWTLAAHESKVFLSYSTLSYNSAFDPDGNIFDHPCYTVSDQSIQLSLETGITERITGVVRVPYKMVNNDVTTNGFCDPLISNDVPEHLSEIQSPQGGQLNALGNIETGLVYKLSPDNQINASLFAEWNTSNFNYIDGTSTGMNSAAIIPGISWAYGKEKIWTSAYVAGEIRTNNYPSAFRGRYEFGFKPYDFLYVAINASARLPLGNDEDCDCTLTWSSLYLAEQTYVALTIKTGFEYKDFGLHLATGVAPYAANIGAAPVATIGLSYHLKPLKSE